MVEQQPVAELSPFSSPNAVPTEWSRARTELASAEVIGCRPFDPMDVRM